VSVRGAVVVAGVESSKLAAQVKVRILLAACVLGPFGFAVAMRVQSSLPVDTLFGRAVKESGFAVSLVVLGFAALWVFPALASSVCGDLFSAEDRYGTWKTVLTRSRSRSEIFAGKALTALGFASVALSVLAISSIAAGIVVIGSQPVIDLTGSPVPSAQALVRVTLAWVTAWLPVLAFAGLALVLSVWTRSSATGIGLPVVLGLVMQLVAFVDIPEEARLLLITSAFGAWHGLLSEPTYYGPLVRSTVVSGIYLIVCLAAAYRLLRRRDIGG
jgi:ABC-2 type transport system permease protein